WQTLAAFALAAGRLAAPFGIRAPTGFCHYFVTAAGTREPKKVRDFQAWLREEMAGTLALFRSSSHLDRFLGPCCLH
ncbi:hypothetical protein ACC690_39880, partial [Rhizobium johnstonii]